MKQERSRSPLKSGEVVGEIPAFKSNFGSPLGEPHNILGTSTLVTLNQDVDDYSFAENEDEYGNPKPLPPRIGAEVIGGNGMFRKMTDKTLLRAALAKMRENSDISIGNSLENSLTKIFTATGAPFSDRDWLAVEDSVLGQSRAELASSFLDTLSLADLSSNYYGKRRRNTINELWKKSTSINEIINVHLIKFNEENKIGGPRYCVSYGIKGVKNTKFNCAILMTLPASIKDQGPDQNPESNQQIAQAILNNSNLLSQLIACYGEGSFSINVSVKTMFVREQVEDTSPQYAKIQLYLALFDAFMFQLRGLNALHFSFIPSDFVLKLSKVIIDGEETASLIMIQNRNDVLKQVHNKTASLSVVVSFETIKDISLKINTAEGPELYPPTDGFSFDKLASLSAIKRSLVESEAKNLDNIFLFENEFLYPGFKAQSTKISVHEDDKLIFDFKGSRGVKRKIGEPTIARMRTSGSTHASGSAINGLPPNEAKKRKLKQVVNKLGVELIPIETVEDVERGGAYATGNYNACTLGAVGGPNMPCKVGGIGEPVGSDLDIIDEINDAKASFMATDTFGQSLDKQYTTALKLVEEFAKKHKTLCIDDVINLINQEENRTYKRLGKTPMKHVHALHTGGFGKVYAFKINGEKFVYKILFNPTSQNTIINEADKYDKAIKAYATRKAKDKENGLIGTMLCPTMRIFRTFECEGKIVSLLAEPLTRSLADFMNNENPYKVHKIYISVFKQLLNGLSFMRNEFEFMHGDLKSNNVMMRHIGNNVRLDYRADDLKFNGEEVVISMLDYQAVFIDFGYSTMFDYPTKTREGVEQAGVNAQKMSSYQTNAFGSMRMQFGNEPIPEAYFRGYRPFMLESGKNGMTLKPVNVKVPRNDGVKWNPNILFKAERGVNPDKYFNISYIDIVGIKHIVPTVPYFIPSTGQLEGPGSRTNPPLYYYNDTMDFLAMFCQSDNIKCVSALSVFNHSFRYNSNFFHRPESLFIFSKIIESIWRKEPMLKADYSALRDAKIFHLPLLYKYIFDEFKRKKQFNQAKKKK